MFGYVRYFAKAKVVRGLLKFDYNAKKHFTVNSILDLNREPNAHVNILKLFWSIFHFHFHTIHDIDTD